VESLADEAFGDLRAVGVGCVDKDDTEFDGAAEDAASVFWIVWFSPGAVANEAHRSISETVDREVATDLEGATGGGGWSGHDAYDAG
jgi:hypothetical protein